MASYESHYSFIFKANLCWDIHPAQPLALVAAGQEAELQVKEESRDRLCAVRWCVRRMKFGDLGSDILFIS